MAVRSLVLFLFFFLFFAAFGCSEPDAGAKGPGDPALADADKPFYQTLETPPAPILNPDQALASFVLAPDFDVALAAAEPLLEDPVAADWDEDGRLYVAEMRAYMPDVDGTGEEEPIGAIARLSDTDGDGVFDRREVLLDGLVLPRAVRIVNEGLLVAEMGKLWLCPSASGWSADIDCSAKRFLGPYGEHQGSVEHAENGLLVGLDNWIYSAKSARRLKLVDGVLVEQPTIFRGQWGITQDDAGRLFYNTNSNMLLGDFYDTRAAVEAGIRGGPGFNQRISADDEVFSVRVNPGVNRAYLPGVLRSDGRLRSATSASGMVVYRGGRFGPDQPQVFVAEPAANVVGAYHLREDGIGVRGEHQLYPNAQWGEREFLASTDERFRPVELLNGPDGALYVVDFYRGVIQDHVYLSDELKAQVAARGLDRPLGMGRLWRITHRDAGPVAMLPRWRELDAPGLVALLDAPDVWRRATAQRLLIRFAGDDISRLLAAEAVRGSEQASVRALWILQDRAELNRATTVAALARGGLVAEAALLAGGESLVLEEVLGALQELKPGTRGYLYALGLLRGHADDAVLDAALTALAENIDDAHIRTFVRAAVRGREAAFIGALVAQDAWTAQKEAATGILAQLAEQLFRAEGAGAVVILDYVAGLSAAELWVQQALLAGLFETTRQTGFERAELASPHALFASVDAALLPAVSRARRGFTWPGDDLAADAKPLTPLQSERMAAGKAFYKSSCANCHGEDGAGIGELGPPLAQSPWVTEAPERLARIVLQGLQGPIEVAGKTWNSAMPGHKDFPGFDDRVASGLLTYLRRSWGHAARAIDPEFVAAIRTQTQNRTELWRVEELNALDLNTHYKMYAGRYGRPQAPTVFAYDGRDLTIDAGIFSGPLVELKEDHFLFEPRDLRFEFVVADDGSVPAVLVPSGEGYRTAPRVSDE